MVASSQVIVIKMVDAEVILVGNYLSFFFRIYSVVPWLCDCDFVFFFFLF